MPFGRYKGKALSALPDDYIIWLDGLDNLRDPLRTIIAKEWDVRFGRAQPGPVLTLTPARQQLAKDMIQSGFRSLAKVHHPDVGGRHEDMLDVIAVYQWLNATLGAS